MRPKHVTYIIAASDDDAVCTAQTRGTAGALTLNGALVSSSVATFTIPRHVLITAVSDEHLVNFVLVGTDRFGSELTETIAGPTAGSTVTTTGNFKTITSVSVSAGLTGNVKVGSANSLETGWIPLDKCGILDCGYTISSGGAMNVDVQTTIGDVFNTSENSLPIDGALGGNAIGMQTATGVRLKITSHVSGNVTFDVINKRI